MTRKDDQHKRVEGQPTNKQAFHMEYNMHEYWFTYFKNSKKSLHN